MIKGGVGYFWVESKQIRTFFCDGFLTYGYDDQSCRSDQYLFIFTVEPVIETAPKALLEVRSDRGVDEDKHLQKKWQMSFQSGKR